MLEKGLSIASTFTGLVPVITGIFVFKKVGLSLRLFIFFLLYGFLTDILIWYLITIRLVAIAQSIFFVYALIEAVFFSWFIFSTTSNKIIKRIAKTCLFVFPLTWFILHIDLKTFHWLSSPLNVLFIAFYKMIISWLGAACILSLTQLKKALFKIVLFWMFSGVFFYCFCTFFISTLVLSKVVHQIWFIHNLFNILSYFIYSFGFLVLKDTQNIQK